MDQSHLVAIEATSHTALDRTRVSYIDHCKSNKPECWIQLWSPRAIGSSSSTIWSAVHKSVTAILHGAKHNSLMWAVLGCSGKNPTCEWKPVQCMYHISHNTAVYIPHWAAHWLPHAVCNMSREHVYSWIRVCHMSWAHNMYSIIVWCSRYCRLPFV